MLEPELHDYALQCAKADLIDALPAVIDVRTTLPPNPPAELQAKFVGLSFEPAFVEAYSFVAVVRDKLATLGFTSLEDSERIIDFGSGWGRISRMLLRSVAPTNLYALDVDPEMTALMNVSLPGVNSVTVTPNPPTILGDATFDGLFAFSVFSHLTEKTHIAWAKEFGRIIRPGGFCAVTVLDESLFAAVRQANKEMAEEADPSSFARSMSKTFVDIDAHEAGFARGEFQFSGAGDDGARNDEFYGWAAAPTSFVQREWGAAGFDVVDWVPANVIFPQALVILRHR